MLSVGYFSSQHFSEQRTLHIAKMDALPAELVEHVLASSPEILDAREAIQ